MRKKRSGFVTASRNRRRFYRRQDRATVLHPGQRVSVRTTLWLGSPSMWAIRPKPVEAILLKGFIVQHISEPPCALRYLQPTARGQ